MADEDQHDEELREHSVQLDVTEPFAAIDRAMAEILADFEALAIALALRDCDRIEAAASRMVDAWLVVDAMVELLDALTPDGRDQLRAARHALSIAGQVVDELFARSLACTDGPTAAFVARVRATVAFVLDPRDPSSDPASDPTSDPAREDGAPC